MRTEHPNRGKLTALVAANLLPGLAFAYVGPGAGVSVLGALWGLIVGVVVALGVVLFFPVRILLRKLKKQPTPEEQAAAKQAAAANSDASSQPPAA